MQPPLAYITTYQPKFHTISAGHRWKAVDTFSPRVWAGRPYASKQISITPGTDIAITKVHDFQMKAGEVYERCTFQLNGVKLGWDELEVVAGNDGLTLGQFVQWFCGPNLYDPNRKDFAGQVLCWSDAVSY